MKTAIQAGYFIEKYGQETGAKRIAELGYDGAYYVLPYRYDSPFVTEWDEKRIEAELSPIRELFASQGLRISHLEVNVELFNDHKPQSSDARTELCIKAAFACRLLGADTLVVKPASHCFGIQNQWQSSKDKTYAAFDKIKAACDNNEVKMAVCNSFCYLKSAIGYACSAKELKELCDHYGVKAIVNPYYAQRAGKSAADIITACKDSLEGLIVNDIELGMNSSMLPLMGAVDYFEIHDIIREASEDAYVIMSMDKFMGRFEGFGNSENLMTAIDEYLKGVAEAIGERD